MREKEKEKIYVVAINLPESAYKKLCDSASRCGRVRKREAAVRLIDHLQTVDQIAKPNGDIVF